MKKFLLILIFLMCYINIFSAWVDVDGIGQESKEIFFNNQPNYVPDIALDSNGYPHIVWFSEEVSGNLEIYYLKWNGANWVDADGVGQESINISNTPGISKYPVIQIDSSNNPHIVWQEHGEIYYIKWNGSQWVDIDGVGLESINVSNSPSVESHHPSFVLDSTGKPHIAWHEGNEDEPPLAKIFYATWNGSSWVGADGGPIGAIYNSPYPSLWASIAVDSLNRPHIVWSDGDEKNREIYYLKWNGSAWVDADGVGQESINISNTPLYSSWPDIEIDASGSPHVVYEEVSEGNQEIFYQKWNGTQWVDVDGVGLESRNMTRTYHYSSVPTIKLDITGTPHIAWHEGSVETSELYCLKWNGTQWVDEDGSGRDEMNVSRDFVNSEWSSMVLDNNGYPHLVWSNGVVLKAHGIHYLHWVPGGSSDTPTVTPTFTINTTQAITPVITPTPSNPCWVDADGIGQESKIISPGKKPSLNLDISGNPHIAWQSDDGINYLHWNGIAFVDADGTGQEGKKISYTISNCRSPSLCFDSTNKPCIAFIGGLFTGWESIYYFKWNGNYWADIDGTGNESASIPVPMGGFPQDVCLAIDSNNNPHIAWSDFPADLTWTAKNIYYVKWNGSDWVDADGVSYESITITSDLTENSVEPFLLLDNNNFANIVYVVNNYSTNFSALCFLKWNGITWVDVDGAGTESKIVFGSGNFKIRSPVMRFDSFGNPHIVWSGSTQFDSTIRINYLYWNGSQWVDADGAGQESISLPLSNDGYGPSLELDASGNPHISFYSSTGVYYLRWNGNQWVDADGIGTESAKIDNNSFDSQYGYQNNTSLKLDNQGKPNISWYDDSEGMDFIYFMRYVCEMPTPTITQTHTITPSITVTPTITMTYTQSLTATITPSFTVTPTLTPFPEGFFLVYPNPFNINESRDGKIKFLNTKPNSTIYIYTISGEIVVSIISKTNVVLWDVKNRFGYKVSPGVYYYIYVTDDNEVIEKGKIFIIKN